MIQKIFSIILVSSTVLSASSLAPVPASAIGSLSPQPKTEAKKEIREKSQEKPKEKSKAEPIVSAPPIKAKDGAEIAVIVNKDAISKQDIYDRAKLILLTSGMANNQQMFETIKEQVKKSLIDEKIQLQASKEQKIFVSEAEITDGLKNISSDNGMTVDQMKEMFKKQGISIKTLEDRLRAQISWVRTVRDAFGGIVHINEKDVSAELSKIQQNKNKNQYDLFEIFLRVENPNQESIIKKDADRIHQQLKAGAHFHVIAQQFSQATSSAKGGHVGWMTQGQMEPPVEANIQNLHIGEFSTPIRTTMGYKIILVKDIKMAGQPAYGQTEITYRQVYIPFTDDMTEAQYQMIDTHIQEMHQIKSCDRLSQKAKDHGYECEISNKASFNSLPAGFQKLFHNAKIGQCHMPIRQEDHLIVAMVCTKESPEEKLPKPDEIRMSLEQEKLNKIATREFNKLKSVSFIDDKSAVSSVVSSKQESAALAG